MNRREMFQTTIGIAAAAILPARSEPVAAPKVAMEYGYLPPGRIDNWIITVREDGPTKIIVEVSADPDRE